MTLFIAWYMLSCDVCVSNVVIVLDLLILGWWCFHRR